MRTSFPVGQKVVLMSTLVLNEEHNIMSLSTAYYRDELRYSLIGLHTCGDLGPVILKLFTQVRPRSAPSLTSMMMVQTSIELVFPRTVEPPWWSVSAAAT